MMQTTWSNSGIGGVVPTQRPDPKEYQTWLRIRDKQRDDRCAAMRRRAAAELGLFPRR